MYNTGVGGGGSGDHLTAIMATITTVDHGRFVAKFDPRDRQMVVMVAGPTLHQYYGRYQVK